ncbi:MAG: sigma-70 family RNA polymerase sigma factor [Phycisphaerales bacterium]|nr:sigma-70 family RNA polymerase sigma factor [Phycisphaerales bacterium]
MTTGDQQRGPTGVHETGLAGLVSRAQAGDEVALDHLLSQAHDALLEQIERSLPPHLERLCWGEDVLAETFACVARGIGTFQAPQGARFEAAWAAWMAEIAEHRVVDLVRREGAMKRPPADRRLGSPLSAAGGSLDGGAHLADAGPSPSRQARIGELHAAVQAAIERIYPDYREVVELRLTLGLSNAQIAARIGRNEVAVRKLFCRAIQQLREEIGDWSKYLSRS